MVESWYIPDLKGAGNLTSGWHHSAFYPAFNRQNQLSAEMLQHRHALQRRLFGVALYDFSLERLALHETLIGTTLQFGGTNHNALNLMVNRALEHVTPAVAAMKEQFEATAQEVKQEVAAARSALESDLPLITPSHQRYRTYHARLEGNDVAVLDDFLESLELQTRWKAALHTLISAPGGLLAQSGLEEEYGRLPIADEQNRHCAVVAGGAGSGKTIITERLIQQWGVEPLVVDSDRYREQLAIPDNDRLTIGTVTQLELQVAVIWPIIRRWQEMTRQGKAPHCIVEMTRAGTLAREIFTSEGQTFDVHVPLCPIETALQRVAARAAQTGRYVPTMHTLERHRRGVEENLPTMCAGIDYTFYNTALPMITPLEHIPVVARYRHRPGVLSIENMGVMWRYFCNAAINPEAQTSEQLAAIDPAIAVGFLCDYSAAMRVEVRGKNGKKIAEMVHHNDQPAWRIYDISQLKEQMGENAYDAMMKGMQDRQVSVVVTRANQRKTVKETGEAVGM